ERKRHLQHRGRGQELPASAQRRDELRDDHSERTLRACAEEGQSYQQVVPNAEEDEDRQRGNRRNGHRHGDAKELHCVAGAVHLRRLEDLAWKATEVVTEQEDLKWKAEARVGQTHRIDGSAEAEQLKELEERDQRHLYWHHHEADYDDEEQ